MKPPRFYKLQGSIKWLGIIFFCMFFIFFLAAIAGGFFTTPTQFSTSSGAIENVPGWLVWTPIFVFLLGLFGWMGLGSFGQKLEIGDDYQRMRYFKFSYADTRLSDIDKIIYRKIPLPPYGISGGMGFDIFLKNGKKRRILMSAYGQVAVEDFKKTFASKIVSE